MLFLVSENVSVMRQTHTMSKLFQHHKLCECMRVRTYSITEYECIQM